MSAPDQPLPAQAGKSRLISAHSFQLHDRSWVKRWRPASFSKFALISTIIAISPFLAGVVVTHIENGRTGAILNTPFGDDVNDVSNAQTFMYQQFPTILTVVFGIWISVLDLDVKRLDPWSRLSSGSSSAMFSLYDTDFILSVVYKSLRASYIYRPHRSKRDVHKYHESRTKNLTVGAPQAVVDASTQTKTMTNNFQVAAYFIAWLGQSHPLFTTNSYTLAPFDHSTVQKSAQISVIVATTRYSAEASCWKPEAAVHNTTSKRISFADGSGCQTKDAFDDDAYWNVQNSQYLAVHIPVMSPGFAFEDGNARETNATSMCPNFP
ncbi:uncharacterized protein A1O9_06508 [Exophiala aquamarina CBS 119918]|uniref:Uncharacterized protein n=1 Tax=Exophiala aquamarina CBS 119918 TaxID=1182545 RepID=A0A072PFN9_9EURO|nr:uncharacterized protein A1O9_06508 [Exophiala aquamarina CBS 119918]KEF58582.1 hypothetical protein A1O9_06508 [Exophiala aquamarina CBS 119918]